MAATKTRIIKCEIGGVSAKKHGYSLGVKFGRESVELSSADELFNGATLQCELIPGKDVDGQKMLFDEKYSEEFTAECKRLSASPTDISLSFHINSKGGGVTLSKLESFTFKTCKLKVKRTGDAKHSDDDAATLPVDDPSDETPDDDAGEDQPEDESTD